MSAANLDTVVSGAASRQKATLESERDSLHQCLREDILKGRASLRVEGFQK